MTDQEEKQMAEDKAYVELFWEDVRVLHDPDQLVNQPVFHIETPTRFLALSCESLNTAWATARQETETILHEANYLKMNISVLMFASEETWGYALKLLKGRLGELVQGLKTIPFGPWPVE